MSVVLPWLVVAALLVTLVAVIDVAIKQREKSLDEIYRLKDELATQKRVTEELRHYAEEMAKISGDKGKVSEQIKEAKNDEELMAIITGLARANNDRVRK